jgi:thiamine-monophosphate kinase
MPVLRGESVPISAAARQTTTQTGVSPLHHALCDGEDYELLIVVRARSNQDRFEHDWQKRFPKVKLSPLGHFVSKGNLPEGTLRLADYRGYEHLR